MSFEQGPEDREYITRGWGFEEYLINCPEYCSKLLWITPGFQSSLHYHTVKKETFIALDGVIKCEYYPEPGMQVITTLVGARRDMLTLTPGTPHRFWSIGGCGGLVLEVSTFHDDADVTRMEPSREINPDTALDTYGGN
jgi:D-lyxose ketol-isomerase